MKKNLKDYIIWGTIACLLILILILISSGEETSFEIEDRCGPIMNLISHTVADQSVCTTRCKSQCETMKLSFGKVNFEEAKIGCHSCTCFCKEGLFS